MCFIQREIQPLTCRQLGDSEQPLSLGLQRRLQHRDLIYVKSQGPEVDRVRVEACEVERVEQQVSEVERVKVQVSEVERQNTHSS